MDEAEFDKFAEEYRSLHSQNIRASGETPEYFAEYKVRDAAALLRGTRSLETEPSILDFGAGTGTSVPFFRQYFRAARLTCVDVSAKSLDIGRGRFGSLAEFVQFDGRTLPFDSEQFDFVFAACVFHHIDRKNHVPLLRELRRVLRPEGLIMVYEHNPYNPLTVRAVNSCPFDENAELIPARLLEASAEEAGFQDVRTKYRVFFPRFLQWLRRFEAKLFRVPLGAQYYVFARK